MIKTIEEYWFFAESIQETRIVVGTEEMHHMHHVLRIQPNTRIIITDGNGQVAHATILEIDKKHVGFTDIQIIEVPPRPYSLHVAISPTKNMNRFEWFLEKATEIGISEITPIVTKHSERTHIRTDRMDKIILSAVKQSKKAWKPKVNELTDFNSFVSAHKACNGFMAYLGKESQHLKHVLNSMDEYVVLVGPEGGFAVEEYDLASELGFRSVSLGQSRLRTETAGIVATEIVAMHFDY